MPDTEAGKRLAADICMTEYPWLADDVDRIEAEARNTLDEERLARALRKMVGGGADAIKGPFDVGWLTYGGEATFDELAAAIAKAYREDEG